MNYIRDLESDSKIGVPLVFHGLANYGPASGAGSVCVDALVEPATSIPPEMRLRDALKMIEADEPINAMVVVSEEKPVGLISSLHIERILSKQFGIELFHSKPVSRIMDEDPLKVEVNTPIDVAAELAMRREKAKIFDHVIVQRSDSLVGIVSVPKMLDTLARLERERRERIFRHERRSIRKFKPEQIKEGQLNAILEAGMYAPSGANQQSALFVVIQDRETLKKLSAMNAAVLGKDIDPYYGAPTLILVFADKNKVTPLEDGSIALGNMLNAAASQGVGSCWVHRAREMFETEEGKALMRKWGVAGDFIGVGSCILGYPDGEHPKPAPRKDKFVIRV